jgi:glutamate synthase domain-containing protein 1
VKVESTQIGDDGQSEPWGGATAWTLPPKQGLYDPRFEHDACGIGFVAHIEGRRSHRVLEMGLEALRNHAHRGAVADDRKTGDGAGILTQLPHEFFARELARMGVATPAPGDLAVGQIFLNKASGEDRALAREVMREVLAELKLEMIAFRSVPVIESALGQRALVSRPWFGQILVRRNEAACEAGDAFERLLYLARKRIINTARSRGVQRLYISSLSSRTIVYKGLVLASELAHFYPDLSDTDYKTAIAVFHQRYSTNTFPTWERAQPFRMICHNGEINTLQGNENWMRAREADLASPFWENPHEQLRPIIARESSDSGKLDNALELLVRSGRDIRHALMMMIPEAWERMPEGEVTPERRAFYEYHSALMEPWDGPAAVTYTDGRIVGTIMDRNGLRPARYVVLDNGLVISASEVGAVAYDESRVIKKGRIGPGQILCVDTTRGAIMEDEEITQRFAARRPYDKWIKENLVHLDELVKKSELPIVNGQLSIANEQLPPANGTANGASLAIDNQQLTINSTVPLPNRQASFGYTSEEMIVVLRPMLTTGHEPVGAMGDDTPIAALSKLPRPLFGYFKQRFAEVTNPPIDPLREEMVMSTRMLLGRRANVLSETPEAVRLLALKSPVLLPAQMATLRGQPLPAFKCATVEAVWPAPVGEDVNPEEAGAALRAAVDKLCREAEDAVRGGAAILVISDERADVHTLPIPSLLAVGAVHHHLIRCGLRMRASLVVCNGRGARGASLRRAGRLRRQRRLSLPGLRNHPGYRPRGAQDWRTDRGTGNQELRQGGGQGAAQDHEQDGHQHPGQPTAARRFLRRWASARNCWTWRLWIRPACLVASASPAWQKMCWPGISTAIPTVTPVRLSSWSRGASTNRGAAANCTNGVRRSSTR